MEWCLLTFLDTQSNLIVACIFLVLIFNCKHCHLPHKFECPLKKSDRIELTNPKCDVLAHWLNTFGPSNMTKVPILLETMKLMD